MTVRSLTDDRFVGVILFRRPVKKIPVTVNLSEGPAFLSLKMSDPVVALSDLRLARAGDPAAWDRLFHRYQRPLYVFACEYLRNEASALDVVQETFINAIRHLGSLREETRFGSWLFGIAHQKCEQQRRRLVSEGRWSSAASNDEDPESGTLDALDGATDDAQLDPAEWLVRAEDAAEFLGCLDQLPDAQRALLLLRFVDDFSLAEIARITDVPVGTVKSRLHHARAAFRNLFQASCHATSP